MDNEQPQKISTDVAIATLTADFKNLRKDFNEFHMEVKENFKDLKENYSDKVNKTDFKDHENRLRDLEKYQENLVGKFTIITAVVSVGIALLVGWIKTKI